MSRIVFHHADKDLIFTVSPLHWDEQQKLDEQLEPFALPRPSAADAGKFLMIGPDGQAHYTSVTPGAVDFNLRSVTVTGNSGSPELNLNNMDNPLIIHPSELVIVKDQESGDSFIFTGGVGTYGNRAGGQNVTVGMLNKIETGPLNVNFATDAEVAEGAIDDKALNPENADYLDVDGGKY